MNQKEPHSNCLSVGSPSPNPHAFSSVDRKGVVAPLIVVGIVATALVAAGLYFAFSGKGDGQSISPILAEVAEGEFVSQVLDQGEVQSSENVEIRCEVRARNGSVGVIEVVPEGSRVKEGDFLVRLDSSGFDVELESQKISLANAKTTVIQADAAVKVAEESLNEYVEGVFKEKSRELDNEIFDAQTQIATANQELQQSKEVFKHSQTLAQKGLITAQQLDADRFLVEKNQLALKRAENTEQLAKQKKEIYQTITQKKELIQFRSDIEAANVKLLNEKESLEIEKNKMAEIEKMIEKCVVTVPEGVQGQVVYAKESSRGGNDWVLEEGTTVRERQVLIRLPNPDKMEVKALINEQSITQIRTGMPATIKVDALSGVSLKGIVTKVNQYAESSGWMSSSIRKYAVLVRIINPPEALKPGMNASVAIQVRYEPSSIMAPIQTVYAVGEQEFCLVKRGENDWETREIEVDGDNSQMVLIKSGVKEGEELVMNPGAYKELMDLPEQKMDSKIEISESDRKRVGDEMKKDKDSKGGPAAGQSEAKGGRPGGGRPGGGGGGRGGFSMPASGAELIKSKDTDGDGKLTKDEAGSSYSRFFDFIDTDKDGFLSVEEADKSIKAMKARMQGGGGGGGRPGGGGGRPGGSR